MEGFHREGDGEDEEEGGPALSLSLGLSRNTFQHSQDCDHDFLSLKLGGNSYLKPYQIDPGYNDSRPRTSLPVMATPRHTSTCQGDGCTTDLNTAKDYHRRHKVCEVHARAPSVLVRRILQRFCQQCSRFHPLEEFDDGRRSCRKRLAGHNKRRKKSQPCVEDGSNSNLVSHLATTLAQLQGEGNLETVNGVLKGSVELVKNLKDASTFLDNLSKKVLADAETKAEPSLMGRDNQIGGPASKRVEAVELCEPTSSKQTLTKMPETGLLASNSKQAQILYREPTDLSYLYTSSYTAENLQNSVSQLVPDGVPRLCENLDEIYLTREPDCDPHNKQIISSCGPFKSDQRFDVITARSLNAEGYSSFSSLARKNGKASRLESSKAERISDNFNFGSDQGQGSSSSELQEWTDKIIFKLYDRHPEDFPPHLLSQILDWLSCFPSNTESFIRPGCVVLTMFLAMPILSWKMVCKDLVSSVTKLVGSRSGEFWCNGRVLVQVQQETVLIFDGDSLVIGIYDYHMESYGFKFLCSLCGHVKPPKVIPLSDVCVSGEPTVDVLPKKINSFVHAGRIQTHNFLRPLHIPYLLLVKPFAVKMGESVELEIEGIDLKISGTRVICSFQETYIEKDATSVEAGLKKRERDTIESPSSSFSGLNSQHIQSFSFTVGPFNKPGRCFIEVEERHGFGGKAFPIIVADGEICDEICTLEKESSPTAKNSDSFYSHSFNIKSEALYFLQELGWLFQTSQQAAREVLTDNSNISSFSIDRFKWVLLFAVDRSWCALTKVVLDLLFDAGSEERDANYARVFTSLTYGESLLHRAVRVNSRAMVKFLMAYKPPRLEGAICIFTPDMTDREGRTPLHIAASIHDASTLVDELTNDPHLVSLRAWTNSRDATGKTPLTCASEARNISYIKLVDEKVRKARREKGQALKSLDTEMPSQKAACSICCLDKSYDRLACASSLRLGIGGMKGSMYRPFLRSLICITAVCATISLLLKGPPEVLYVKGPFTWESVSFGTY